jgi:trk system potassium uptake protein TrkH
VYRLMLMTAQLFHEVFRLIYPHGVKRLEIAGEGYDPETSRAVWTALFAWLIAFVGTLFVTALAVPDFTGAYLAALAIVSNMAQLYDASWGGAEAAWPGWVAFPAVAKLALCAAMIVGRLEVIAVMVVVYGLLRRR